MSALFAGVTEVMKNHHDNHKNRVSYGEDVERRPPHILCFDVEIQVALENQAIRARVDRRRQEELTWSLDL